MQKKIHLKGLIILIISFVLIIYYFNHLSLPFNTYDDLNTYDTNFSDFNDSKINEFNLLDNYKNLNPFTPSVEILGMETAGSVIKAGPYGNKSSSVKIAYLIGVHPLEQQSHQAILNMLLENQDDLKHCYYIYIVGVKQEPRDYNKSRYYGQLLAYKYAVSDIKKNKFNLVIDIHSNQGKYEKKTFIFSAIPNDISISISSFLIRNLPGLSYYVPPRSSEPTSAPYISEPLIKNGIPTIVYETYRNENLNTSEKKAEEFIIILDRYNFKST